jgi:hypothetical protein
MKKRLRAVAPVALVCLVLMAAAVPAAAHETNETGGYSFVIGWGIEPAYVGQLNSVQVLVRHQADGDPVNDAGARLKATVAYGGEQVELDLAPTFSGQYGTGTPGEYRALLMPTAPGDYTFHITGTVGGVKVNEKVTSSPKTFSSVEDVSAVQFPVWVPGVEQVAQRLEQEIPRLATQAGLADEVSSARTLGYVGIAVGAVGIVLAAVALLVRRRA